MDIPGMLFKQLMTQFLLSKGEDREIFKVKQSSHSTDRILGINHYKTPVTQFPLLVCQMCNIDFLVKYFIRKLKKYFYIINAFQKVFHCPDSIKILSLLVRLESSLPSI